LTTAKTTEFPIASTITFDVETNALKPRDVTTIHCCALRNGEETVLYEDPEEWLSILENAEVLVGHNIIQYDIPCIQSVYPRFKPKGRLIDTLILCRMFYSNIKEIDFKHKWPTMPLTTVWQPQS
jgi:DNA polymerase I